MTPMPCSVRCRGAAWPPGPACGTPGASGANDVGGRLGTAAWAWPPGHGRHGRRLCKTPGLSRWLNPACAPPAHHGRQPVDFLGGVVEGQRGPHGGLHAEAPQDGLGAVVAGAHGDAFGVERLAHLGRGPALEHEGQYAGLVGRRADQAQAGDGRQRLRAVLQQIVLVARDALHAQGLHVVDGGAQATASAMLPVPASKVLGRGW